MEAILAVIESHPERDYGAPGALVHFAEELYRQGYEAALLRSLARRPTMLTVWMMNRLLNGTARGSDRARYASAFRQAATHPAADAATRAEIARLLERIDRSRR